jgi:hypothetical protein
MTTHLRISLALALTLYAFPVSATAEPYWITYEGNDLPENEGWERHWGNDEGAHEGDGAIRTVEDGILTMDSLYDLRVYDYACHYLYGELDPDPGELFVAEWRGLVDEVLGDHYDAKVGISSDDDWQLGIACFPDHILSKFEDVEIPIEPGMFHEYRVLSWDMQTYDLGETASAAQRISLTGTTCVSVSCPSHRWSGSSLLAWRRTQPVRCPGGYIE